MPGVSEACFDSRGKRKICPVSHDPRPLHASLVAETVGSELWRTMRLTQHWGHHAGHSAVSSTQKGVRWLIGCSTHTHSWLPSDFYSFLFSPENRKTTKSQMLSTKFSNVISSVELSLVFNLETSFLFPPLIQPRHPIGMCLAPRQVPASWASHGPLPALPLCLPDLSLLSQQQYVAEARQTWWRKEWWVGGGEWRVGGSTHFWKDASGSLIVILFFCVLKRFWV